MKHRLLVALAAILLLAGAARAEEAAGRVYLDWVLRTLDAVEADLPAIAKAADLVAEPFCNGKNFGVRGGVGMNEELGARSGGFVIYRSTPGKPGEPVLYCFGTTTAKNPDAQKVLETELADAEKLLAAESVVIGIASFDQLKSLGLFERAQKACTQLLDNHSPASGALFTDQDGKPMIPTSTVAHPIVAWAWCGELFAACTRRGKTPAMYKSVMVDRSRERYEKYKDVKFHDDLHVEPQEAQKLGKAYLDGVRGVLRDFSTASWKPFTAACDQAAGTLKGGGKVYLFLSGHYPPYHQPGALAYDPSLFVPLNVNSKLIAQPGPADYVLGLGYMNTPTEEVFGQKAWGDADKVRQAGRGVAWIVAAFNYKPEDLKPNEILVDQRWPEGDAAVQAPGYDVKILPPSGVVGEAILWAMTAQVWQQTRSPAPMK
jgi:uncharacterized phosphosugar-binding protein